MALAPSLLVLSGPVWGRQDIDSQFQPAPELQDYASVSTKFAQRVQWAPASVTVISAEQIRRMGYQSVGEALGSVPGLYVSNDLYNYHVAVRGIFGGARAASRTLKVMINGRPFSFVQSGIHMLGVEFVPMNIVERIEVMKGPASVLYGAGALVGAINIITKRAPYEGGVKGQASVLASGGWGAEKGGVGNVAVSLTSRSTFVMAGVSGGFVDRSGLALRDTSPILEVGRPDLRGVESRDDFARPIGVVARVEQTLAGGRLALDFLSQFYDYDAEFHDQAPLSGANRVSLFHWKGVVGYERAFASGLSLLGNVGVAGGGPRSSDQLRLQGLSNPRTRAFSYLEISGQSEARYEFWPQGATLLVGVDLSVDREQLQQYFELGGDGTPLDSEPSEPPLETLTNVAGYAEALMPIGSWLRLTGGLRYDYHNIYASSISAQASAVISLSQQLVLKALFGRSYKAPSAEQLFGVAQDETDIVGNPDLRPSFLTGGELILDYFVTRWLNIALSGYGNRLEDGIAYVQRALQRPELTAVTYDAWSLGGELTIRQANDLGPLRLTTTAALSLQNTTTSEEEFGGLVTKQVPDNEAVPQLSAWVRLALEAGQIYLRAFADYRYVGQRTPSQTNLKRAGTPDLRDPIYMLGDYHLLALGVATTPIAFGADRTIAALVKVSNVFNADYAEVGFNGVDVPALGTTAWLQVRLEI